MAAPTGGEIAALGARQLTHLATSPMVRVMSEDSMIETDVHYEEPRDIWLAARRGWRQRCPSCGEGAMYYKYLKVNDVCPNCGTELHHHRADDAPPYFVMIITAHIVVGGILAFEKYFSIDPWIQVAVWCPILVLLSLWLLPRVKGVLIAYQWALRMHGFGVKQFEGSDLPPTEPTPAE